LLLILWNLIGLIRCGLFYVRSMSLLGSLPILLLFVRSSFFDTLTLRLMTFFYQLSVVWRQLDTLGPQLSPVTCHSCIDQTAALELRWTYFRTRDSHAASSACGFYVDRSCWFCDLVLCTYRFCYCFSVFHFGAIFSSSFRYFSMVS
jgi:hypothetical protein